jgi:uncharacterized protein
MNNLGLPIIGLGERNAEYADLPLQWMPHIQVADVAASVQRALDLGGSELMHAKDDDGQSQWAVLLDPNGAAFGIIPWCRPRRSLRPTAAAPGAMPVGRIAWLDLTVADAPPPGISIAGRRLVGAGRRDGGRRRALRRLQYARR